MHVNAAVEVVQNGHEPVYCKAAKLNVADARKLAGIDAGNTFCLAYRKFAIIEHADDLGGQNAFELFHIGPGMAQIAEDIAAASDKFQFLGYVSISFSRLIRSRITSISCFGVLMPLVDFF